MSEGRFCVCYCHFYPFKCVINRCCDRAIEELEND